MPEILGKGAYAKVQKCQSKLNGAFYAVKIVNMEALNDMHRMLLRTEIETLKKLDHPMVMKFHDVYQNASTTFIVTEHCTGVDLFEDLENNEFRFDELKAAIITRQLLEALTYCHDQGIVHRDLKPDNIIFDEDHGETIKLIDFGLSHHTSQCSATSDQIVGTPEYLAPEVIRGSYTEKCDMWSIGVILYVMLSGRQPFGGEEGCSDKEVMENVQRGKYEFEDAEWEEVTEDAKDLIEKLLKMDAGERISAK